MTLRSINPVTGELACEYPEMTDDQVDAAIAAAYAAYADWRRVPLGERVASLRRVADLLRGDSPALARLMALEMGKPVSEGRGEVEKCAWVCEYYAEHAADFLADTPVDVDGGRARVVYRPLGLVLAVMPWNFPLWQFFRFFAPAVAAGNGALLKHASNVTGCAEAIADLVRCAGFPPDLLRVLAVPGTRVERIIRDPRVVAVTLTGSTPAGRAVARTAGDVLKKTVLELGGSDPYVVLDDADVMDAARICATSRMVNGGQTCIAAKRMIVVDSAHDLFIDALVSQMSRWTSGDPLAKGTRLGPMARRDLRDELHEQVEASIRLGARCVLGGEVPTGPGAFYPATVLSEVGPGMPAYSEELFGPVAAVIRARDAADAVRIANDTEFGLAAAIFTGDVERGQYIATEELEAGICFVNDFVRSDPRLPFGGVKGSGYGRELGLWGIREFVNVKTIWVA